MAVKRSSNMALLVVLVLIVSMAVTSPVAKSQQLPGLGGLLGGGTGGNNAGLLGGLLGGGTGGNNAGLLAGLLSTILGGGTGGNNAGLLSGLLAGNGLLNGPLGILGQISPTTRNLLIIAGNASCPTNATTSAQPAANATVMLVCNGAIVADTTTNSNGSFTIILDAASTAVALDVVNCKIVITTPPSSCNPTLPATGGLVAPLQAIGNSTIGGVLNVFNIIPLTFRYVSDLINVLFGGN